LVLRGKESFYLIVGLVDGARASRFILRLPAQLERSFSE
jgi:hypothetical protein